MKKRMILLMILSIFLIGIISAQEVSYCCEQTISGAWCQNAPKEQCNEGYNNVPTSCESTSFCKLGVCINTKEGNCLPNSPQRVCEENGGIWDKRDKKQIPQCQLGCCLIGDQAAFTTQTRCKKLSSIYGLSINYRTDIQNERECISSAKSEVKGACVFEKEYERNCKFLTKKECQDMNSNNTEFFEGFLCSAESLNTICGPRGGTTCVEGKDEVYFLDTCGNIANIYDSARIDDTTYWEKITAPTCSVGTEGKGSTTCGNCDYFLGSTCKKGIAKYGNFICKDLKCTYEGEIYQHGETWCATPKENEAVNSPGGKNFRLVCYNGEVSVEPCAEFRQEVCIQSSVEDFKVAACRANQWQDCYSQKEQKECENTDKRDCKWVKGFSVLKDDKGKTLASGSCVPRYSPGFDFWKNESDSKSMCSLANDVCTVEYYAGVGEGAVGSLISGAEVSWKAAGDVSCMKDCRGKCTIDDPLNICYKSCVAKCLPESCVDENGNLKDSWKKQRQDVCNAIGDCGSKKNYLGKEGYFNWDKSITKTNVKDTAKSSGGGIGDALGGLFGMFK